MSGGADLSSAPISSGDPLHGQDATPPKRRPRWLWLALAAALIVLLFGARQVFGVYVKSQARSCIARRNPEGALDWLKWNDRVDPADAEAEFLRARAYRKLGEFNLLRERLARAFKLGYPVKQLEREQILAHAQAGQLSEAEPHLGKLLTDPDGDGHEICEAFVHGYFLNRRLADALNLIEPWIADYPTSPQPYYVRGHIQVAIQYFKQAESDLRKALELDPQHDATAFELADVLARLHQADAALPYYEQAAKSPKFEMLAGVGKSRCLKILGKHDESRAVIMKVIEKYPSEPLPQQALGQIELEAGNYQQALEHLDRAAEKLSFDTELRNARGTALRGLKRMDEARREFQFVDGAAKALARVHDLRDEVQVHPDDYERRFEIGKILLKYSEPREGVIWLQSVLNYAPQHRGAHQTLADYYTTRANESPAFAKLAKQHRQAAEASTSPTDESTPPSGIKAPPAEQGDSAKS